MDMKQVKRASWVVEGDGAHQSEQPKVPGMPEYEKFDPPPSLASIYSHYWIESLAFISRAATLEDLYREY